VSMVPFVPVPMVACIKRLNFPTQFLSLSLSLSLFLLIITTRQKNNDGRFPSTNNMINLN
jgi:hypothetical protein